jgi:hypothetical protein
MVKWQTCDRCGGEYLPSQTSHPTTCGICVPYKGRVVKKPLNRDWYEGRKARSVYEEA